MGIGRAALTELALLALDDAAEAALAEPVPRSIELRFLLAFLFHASGADPAKRWLYDQFWREATTRRPVTVCFSKGLLSGDSEVTATIARRTSLQAALNGICREAGCERLPEVELALREKRTKLKR
jgi:hypothetical protein